jgi:P-type Ca2+ transporter type 2C
MKLIPNQFSGRLSTDSDFAASMYLVFFMPSRDDAFRFTSRSIQEIYEELRTGPSGLSDIQVIERQQKEGKNELDLAGKETMVDKFIEQFQNPLILLLLGSSSISVLIGQYDDAISIFITVLIVLTGIFF